MAALLGLLLLLASGYIWLLMRRYQRLDALLAQQKVYSKNLEDTLVRAVFTDLKTADSLVNPRLRVQEIQRNDFISRVHDVVKAYDRLSG